MLSLEFGDYEASCVLRRTDKLIVSFAGIGDLANNTPDYEWIESLTAWNNEYSFIFVKDNSRSWYTSSNGISEFGLWLKKLIDELEFIETIAFGLSMGAYGAIIVDSLVRFDLVIALSSRMAVGSKADFDPRLELLSEKVIPHPNNHLINMIRDDGKYVCVYSIDDPCDMMHAVRLYKENKPNLRFFKTRGQHNIGYNIKHTFGLNSFFDWMFIHHCTAPHFAFKPFTQSTVEIAAELEHRGHPNRISHETYNQCFSKLEIESIPRIVLDDILNHSIDNAWKSFENTVQSQRLRFTEYVHLYLLPVIAYSYLTTEEFIRNLSFGWSDLEPNGCWAVGKWHCIEGNVVGLRGSKHAIAIEYDVYLPKGKTQDIRFYLNNDENPIIEKNHKDDESSGIVFIPIVESAFSLVIETPNFTSPMSNDDGEDYRALSLFVKSLAVTSI